MKKKHTVLCVDDEIYILNSLKRILRKENYNLLTAQSGPEGLKMLDKFKVHLVISDQRMPGMYGTEFLKRVKKKFPDVTRIILSGNTEDKEITEAFNEGNIHNFFSKPWANDDLKSEIIKILSRL